MMGGIGEMPGFQRQSVAKRIEPARLPGQGTVEAVTGVALKARVEEILQNPAVFGLKDRRLDGKRSGILSNDPIMVVALGESELIIRGLDTRPDRGGLAEVERRADD